MSSELTVTSEKVEELAKTISRSDDFVRLMTYYRCAIMEIQTKLNVLNAEFSLQYDRKRLYQESETQRIPVAAFADRYPHFPVSGKEAHAG